MSSFLFHIYGQLLCALHLWSVVSISKKNLGSFLVLSDLSCYRSDGPNRLFYLAGVYWDHAATANVSKRGKKTCSFSTR